MSEVQKTLLKCVSEVVTLTEAEAQDFYKRLLCHPSLLYLRLHQLLDHENVSFLASFCIGAFLAFDFNCRFVYFEFISFQSRSDRFTS